MATTAERTVGESLLTIDFHLFIRDTDLTVRYRPYKLEMEV